MHLHFSLSPSPSSRADVELRTFSNSIWKARNSNCSNRILVFEHFRALLVQSYLADKILNYMLSGLKKESYKSSTAKLFFDSMMARYDEWLRGETPTWLVSWGTSLLQMTWYVWLVYTGSQDLRRLLTVYRARKSSNPARTGWPKTRNCSNMNILFEHQP